MESLTQGWTQLGPFFQKLGPFIRFLKRLEEASPLPSSSLRACEYG